ncbi:MAG: formylglycine-generating enzyme family protein [Planctomycetes bacterium]|nr:formylglycine-generating enzyme family protein [Planctomycetota bacterium]
MKTWHLFLLPLIAEFIIGCGSAENKSKEIASSKGISNSKRFASSKGNANSKEMTNSIGMKLVRIPKGKFMMGSREREVGREDNETQHEVILTKDFYLGIYEVTQAEYEKVMGNNPSEFKGASTPVEMVSWNDASEFCKKLSDFPEEKKAGRVYRLPTEAQWEYACRAGTTTPFHFGNELNGTQANCNGAEPYGTEAKGPYLEKTSAVGSYPPNAWGLYDMHGNVDEWCSDWYGEYLVTRNTDPQGPQKGEVRVLRGGSWNFHSKNCRASFRNVDVLGNRNCDNGFRVLLPLDF